MYMGARGDVGFVGGVGGEVGGLVAEVDGLGGARWVVKKGTGLAGFGLSEGEGDGPARGDLSWVGGDAGWVVSC